MHTHCTYHSGEPHVQASAPLPVPVCHQHHKTETNASNVVHLGFSLYASKLPPLSSETRPGYTESLASVRVHKAYANLVMLPTNITVWIYTGVGVLLHAISVL